MSENFRLVFNSNPVRFHNLPHLLCRFGRRKITKNMYFLCSFYLHAGNHQQFLPRNFHHRPNIAAGVMVGDRNHIQSFEQCHVDNIIRRHIRITAGRKRRMDMQVIKHPHIPKAPNSFASM